MPIEVLERKWVDSTDTLYIGRASSLRNRLGLLVRFGRGDAVAHWGGRYLWQLRTYGNLRMCWRVENDPVEAERALLETFEATTGALPFANLVHGTRVTLAA